MSDAVKDAWEVYRIGKMYGSAGEMLENLQFYRPGEKVSKRAPYSGDNHNREPRAGSAFWVWHIDPPDWFHEEITTEDLSDMLAMGAAVRRKRRRKKGVLWGKVGKGELQ